MPSKHRSERTHRQGQVDHDDRDEVVSWDSLSISSSSSYRSSDAARAAKLPALPDLRFEQSYLATIRSFLHERHPSSLTSPNSDDDDEEPSSPHNEKQTPDHDVDHHHKVEIARSNATNQYELWLGNLRVEWYVPPPLLVHAVRRTYADERSNCVRIRFPIFYVTVRDQLLSPLVQGAVWGLGGLLLTQLRQYISARAKGAGLSKPATATKASSGSVLRSLGLNKR